MLASSQNRCLSRTAQSSWLTTHCSLWYWLPASGEGVDRYPVGKCCRISPRLLKVLASSQNRCLSCTAQSSWLTTHCSLWYWLPASGEGMVLIRRQMLTHFPTVTQSTGFQPEPLLIAHYSPLTTHHSLLTTHYSLLTIHRKGLGWKPILSVTGDEVRIMTIAKQLAGSQYQNTLLIAHYSFLTTLCSLGCWLPARAFEVSPRWSDSLS